MRLNRKIDDDDQMLSDLPKLDWWNRKKKEWKKNEVIKSVEI